jgi:hypothetical protein
MTNLENRYNGEFNVTNIEYDPMTEEYLINANVVDKPELDLELDFTFAFIRIHSFGENPPEKDD